MRLGLMELLILLFLLGGPTVGGAIILFVVLRKSKGTASKQNRS